MIVRINGHDYTVEATGLRHAAYGFTRVDGRHQQLTGMRSVVQPNVILVFTHTKRIKHVATFQEGTWLEMVAVR